MHDLVSYISQLNFATMAGMIMLVGAGSYIMSFIMDSRFLVVAFGAAFMAGAILTDYVFKANGVQFSADPDTNLLVISTLGMIAGLLVMVGVIRLYGIATDHSKSRVVRN